MIPLSAGELTAMRSATSGALPDTATVKRPSLSSDGAGGVSQTEPTIGTFSARLDAPGRQLQSAIAQYAARIGERQPFVMNLPYNTDVTEGDRITLNGKVYEAIALLVGSWETIRQVLVVEHA